MRKAQFQKFIAVVMCSVALGLAACVSGPSDTPTSVPASVSIVLTDSVTGAALTNLSVGNPAKVTATVRDTTGKAAANTVVTFTTDSTLAKMTPTSGTALTDASGVATIQLVAAVPTAGGATTITAAATIGGAAVSGSAGFSVTASNLGVPGVSLVLTDPATGASITNISPGSPAKVLATIRDAAGSGVANTVVTFSTTATLAAMTPSTGTALTNAAGVASIQIDAASLTAAGATTITATATLAGAAVSGSTGFSVSAANAGLGSIAVGTNPLSPYATTSVSVAVTGVPATTPVTINFSSICSGAGKATLPASVQTVNGVATATYTDKGCASTDTITASVAGLAVTKTVSLTVQSPGAASIQFVSATPTTIVLKGTGGVGLVESSLVKFKVVDNNNVPILGADVQFDLTTWAGGILLDGTSTLVSKKTDGNGEASVSVQSGTTPTAVWVRASVTSAASPISSQSNQLRISTGRPAQDRFSIGASVWNIDGLNVNGVTSTVTVIASDRLGNPVPDGTAINFISGGAQIEPSCLTASGSCSVKFTSANPRPANGRVTVVAYTVGEESFVDQNGNNKYDLGESFNDLGDVCIDSNENGKCESGEQSISFGASKPCYIFDTTTVDTTQMPNTCSGDWGAAHVRQSALIVMSDSVPAMPSLTTIPMGATCSTLFPIYLKDKNGNAMPAGTKLSIASNSVFDATSPTKVGATINVTPDTVPNSISTLGTRHNISVSYAAGCTHPVSGTFNLNVATPAASSNTTTAIQFTVTGN